MDAQDEGRSARKHAAIQAAATQVFLAKGYPGTSMEEIATLAGVSKQTVYKHFDDKEQLFATIVLATTDRVDEVVRLAADGPTRTGDPDEDLTELARRLLAALMQPQLLQLRRLVIANADRFPDLGRLWYERGFERVLATLAESFTRLAGRGHLQIDDPLLAANHFAGLLLWVPMNKAMFGGDAPSSETDLHHYADAAVRAFLAAYRPTRTPA
jgi:AcrR family transcriptional regulator